MLPPECSENVKQAGLQALFFAPASQERSENIERAELRTLLRASAPPKRSENVERAGLRALFFSSALLERLESAEWAGLLVHRGLWDRLVRASSTRSERVEGAGLQARRP